IRDEYNYPKKKGIKDECSRLLEASTMKSRRGFAIQRLMNAMRQAHADGWFIVFDTLTLADDRLEAFYDNPNALRDYFRDIGRMRSLRLLRVSGIVMRLRMFLLLITFLKASHSFRNRLLVICKNAYLFATMIMTSVSSPFSCCSGIVRLNLMLPFNVFCSPIAIQS